jgi:photosystem II stability/assembly factor-like uncharacterized protein
MSIRLAAAVLLAAFILFALLATLPLPSRAAPEWAWRHPQPQGHALLDMVFLDGRTAIAVGETGTVLVTHDAGNTWIVRSRLFTVGPLRAIDRVDENTAVVVGDDGLILRTDDQGAIWTQVPGGTSQTLNDVSFFDAAHGIIVAWNTAFRTSDGGLTWQSAAVSDHLLAVDMTSATGAIALGDLQGVSHTTDGGVTWTAGNSPLEPLDYALLLSVDFIDPLHGAIAASSGADDGAAPARCFVTADGGATWTPSTLNNGSTNQEFFPHEVLYPRVGEVLIAGRITCCVTTEPDLWPFGSLASSVNDGGAWTTKRINRSAYGLARSDDGVVLVGGDDGRMFRRDLDETYREFGPEQPHTRDGKGLFFDSDTGIVFNSDATDPIFGEDHTYFSRTNDGGRTWTSSRFENVQCADVAYLSYSVLVAVGVNYTQSAVIRSMDGGASWTAVWADSPPTALRAVAAVSATRAVALGSGGTALVIDDGIVTPVDAGGFNFVDVALAGPSELVALGATDARSTDGGQTWAPIAAPANGVRALDFVTATRAFGVAASGILRSEDTGATWTPVFSVAGLRDISFADASHGMAVGDNGIALITTDGGLEWTSSVTPTTRALNSVSMVGPEHAFISGTQQIVLEYGTHTVPTLIRSLHVTARPFGADLRWDVVTDEHLAGFSIVRSSGDGRSTIATGLAASARAYRDDGLAAGRTYEYQLLAVERDGSYTQSAPVKATVPAARVELLPNQPNPFNPATTLRFVVPERTRVQLTVHDVAGRVVGTLVDDTRDPGVHVLMWNAEGMASGVYFARLRAGKTEMSRKLVLLK